MRRGSSELGVSQREIVLAPSPGRGGFFQHIRSITLSSHDVYASEDALEIVPAGIPEYLQPAERRIEELMGLKSNWDGYGGIAVPDSTRDAAIRLLCSVVSERDVLPSIVPGTEGSVNLEWHRPGLELELEVEPSGHVMAYFRQEDGDEWEREYSSVEPRIGDLIARFAK